MSDFSDLSTVRHILEKRAAWRATKAKRFPEDPRNKLASDMLYALATFDEEVSPHLLARLEPYWHSDKFPKEVDAIAMNVGFTRNATHTLNSFLASVASCLEASGKRKVNLPALAGGRAPDGLRIAFDAAVDAYESWEDGENEPAIPFDGRYVLISDVFARMWNCGDMMPRFMCQSLANTLVNEDRPFPNQGATFAQAARRLLPLVKEARNAARQ